MNASLCKAGSCWWPVMWKKWMDLLPTAKACIVGHPKDEHQLWFVTFLGVLSTNYKAGVWLTSVPSRCSHQLKVEVCWQASLGSLHGCCLGCMYSEETQSLPLWIQQFYTQWFCIMFLSSYRMWPWLNFHADYFGINAYPNPLIFPLTWWHLVKRMLPYYILTMCKHKVITECSPPPLMFFKFEY